MVLPALHLALHSCLGTSHLAHKAVHQQLLCFQMHLACMLAHIARMHAHLPEHLIAARKAPC